MDWLNFRKNVNQNVLHILLVCLGSVMACNQTKQVSTVNLPQVKEGKIDFSNWDFEGNGISNLRGNWLFYPEEFIDNPKQAAQLGEKSMAYIPGFWTDKEALYKDVSYGTYHLQITLPDSTTAYCIKLNNIFSSYELWTNNTLLVKVGKIGTTEEDTESDFILRIAELPKQKVVDLFLKVASWEHRRKGGVVAPLLIGTKAQLKSKNKKDFNAQFAYCMISMTVAFYLFAIYFFQKEDNLFLYVGIYALFIALRSICEDDMIIKVFYEDFPNGVHQRLRYISGFMSVGAIIMYVRELVLEADGKKSILWWGYYGGIAFSVVVAILPSLYIISYLAPLYQIFVMPALFYCLAATLKSKKHSKQIRTINLVSLLTLFAITIHTFLLYRGFLDSMGESYNNLASVMFLFGQLWVLGLTRKEMNEKMSSLTKKLKVLNKHVEQKVEERTQQIEEKKVELKEQHHQIEEQRKELQAMNAQLKELDQAKTRFFGNISHELRTQIALILGATQQLQQDQSMRQNDKDLRVVKQYSLILHQLVDQLLDMIKVEAGKMTLEKKQVEIVSFFKDFFFSFKPLAKKGKIRMSFSSNIDKYVGNIDQGAFEKIMYNLLSNACKFTPINGLITLDVTIHDKQAILTLKDTGVGIAKEALPYVFDQFYQADTNKDELGGVGIGLALVKALVELHDGVITVTSREGDGTAFIIHIPFIEETSQHALRIENKPKRFDTLNPELLTPVLKRPRQKLWRKKTDNAVVLIVEDSIDIHGLIKSEFSSIYQLIHAYDGEEGIKLAKQHIPDLIMSDVMMPKKSGFELCEELKQDKTTSHIPIILLTARAEQNDMIRGLRGGADDYIAKPFHLGELRVKVKRLIHMQKELSKTFQQNLKVTTVHPEEVEGNAEDAELVRKVLEILEQKYVEPNLDGHIIAENLGMSFRHVNRKLNVIVGTTLGKMINTFRLEKAKELLQNKEMYVGEVGYLVGYKTRPYFTKSFKDKFGVTPKVYRKQVFLKQDEDVD